VQLFKGFKNVTPWKAALGFFVKTNSWYHTQLMLIFSMNILSGCRYIALGSFKLMPEASCNFNVSRHCSH
jgi:hypothetical protein